MFENYETFLAVLDKKLKQFFEQQKEYVCCKRGCSFCCEEGCYPASNIEYLYIKSAMDRLDKDLQERIKDEIKRLKEQKEKERGDKKWLYKCPFLIDNVCSVYNNRLIVCRTFGIPYFNDEGKIKTPFCMERGLNYHQVYDPAIHKFSDEKFRLSGFKNEPLAYNLSKKFLYNSKLAELTNMHFGEDKALIDWF